LLHGLRCPAVTPDDVRIGVLATEHLIKLGHRRIGHLRGTNVSTSEGRFEGYKQAISKARLRIDKRLVRDCGFTESDGRRAMEEWIGDGDLPPAIFAANDAAAIGAMEALNDAGLSVPNDVAIVGAGNIHYGDMLRVPLTTVSWSTAAMGQAAARLLLDLVDGNKVRLKNRHVTIRPELVVRRSCGAVKQ
jgi:DNA-binding LacI/PurR family transcriptional regulator